MHTPCSRAQAIRPPKQGVCIILFFGASGYLKEIFNIKPLRVILQNNRPAVLSTAIFAGKAKDPPC